MLALCENIRRLRRARGLSQEELAGRLGVSRQSVSLWEQGETNPTVENIYAMSEVLGVSFDELLADPPEGTAQPCEPMTARSFDEQLASSAEGGTDSPAAPPTASFSNSASPEKELLIPNDGGDSVPSDRDKRAEAQYYRYRRLVRGAWIGVGIMGGGFLLFIFAVVILGEFAVRYPVSAVDTVIGPALMLVSILSFLAGLIFLIVMSSRAGSHRRRMGDLFDLATYEELKRGGKGYAAKRK